MKLKKIEELVLNALETNKLSRENDFILYGCVLKRLGYPTDINLFQFLANAKKTNAPSFESVSRCRRHIVELRQDLKESKSSIARELLQEDYKEYNITGMGQ